MNPIARVGPTTRTRPGSPPAFFKAAITLSKSATFAALASEDVAPVVFNTTRREIVCAGVKTLLIPSRSPSSEAISFHHSRSTYLNEKTGESFYTVEVRTSAVLVHDGQKLPIGLGMTANVSLLGDKRSVLSYIFSPLTRVSERAFRE